MRYADDAAIPAVDEEVLCYLLNKLVNIEKFKMNINTEKIQINENMKKEKKWGYIVVEEQDLGYMINYLEFLLS